MKEVRKLMVTLAAGLLGCLAAPAARAADPPPPSKEGIDFFETKIRPVLVKHCYECHSEARKKVKGKLRLDNYEGMLKGGESGKPSVVPGKPDDSYMIFSMTYKDQDTDTHDALLMPPPKNGKPQKLPDSTIDDFRKWIQMGAPYPPGGGAKADAGTGDAKKHWAFVPPKDPPAPQVKNEAWTQSPIDHFVLAKLEEKNLHPSRPADKRALIRRAYYDLIGLPPTRQEVDAFEADNSSDAFAKVVDHLLASPHYGERWGRYWLDVARYSDTKGYVFEEERRYPYSYTYRDWVIRAFNEDKPYDQFLVDQIAADRLDLGNDKHDLAAEGFLTLGRRFLNNLPDIIDDRIDVVCRGTMALTVGCARCHDHKFDPIAQKDYYALYAVFNNSPESHDLPLIENPQPTPEYQRFSKELAVKQASIEQYKQTKLTEHETALRSAPVIASYLLAAQFQGTPREHEFVVKGASRTHWMTDRWRGLLDRAAHARDSIFATWRAYAAIPAEQFASQSAPVTTRLSGDSSIHPLVAAAFASSPVSLKEVAERYGKLLAEADAPAVREDPREESLRLVLRGPDSPTHITAEDLRHVLTVEEGQHARALKREVEAFQATDPGAPGRAMTLEDAPANAEQHVFVRGNPGNPGPLVKPAFLAVLSGGSPRVFTHGSGRLELARAIASKDNPLTARVMVNRIWMHHFGKAIVRTPSDFGTRSDPPTHPQLLDWLAVRFMENGWSIKKLHRLIMLSATYQQSSEEDPVAEKTDPDNTLLSHFNRQRLDWEATRDSLLFAAGKLDETMGGRPVEILDSNRRSVYGFIDRQNLPGVFRAFDFASPDTTSPQRFTTTVPQQALFLMNSPFAVEQAEHVVQRPELAATSDPTQRIVQLYGVLFQRVPTPEEVSLGAQFLASEQRQNADRPVAWQYGYGQYDEARHSTAAFTPLPHFSGKSWQGGSAMPDAKLGWVQLTASGGHPGNDHQHAAIRRWVSPIDGVIRISGVVSHSETRGDGIRAHVISSRLGELASWNVFHMDAATNLDGIEVKKGDTIDFLVDCRGSVEFDSFAWAPVIKVAGPEVAGNDGPPTWDAAANFAGPQPRHLDPWAKYAQVLMESNEFVFVD